MLATALGFLNSQAPSGFVRLQPAQEFDEIWREWLPFLYANPRPAWSEPFVVKLIERAFEKAHARELGWVKLADLRALRDSNEILESAPSPDPTVTQQDDPDDIKI